MRRFLLPCRPRMEALKTGQCKIAVLGVVFTLGMLFLPAAQATIYPAHDVCSITGVNSKLVHVVGNDYEEGMPRWSYLSDWVTLDYESPVWTCTRYTLNPAQALDVGLRTFMDIGRQWARAPSLAHQTVYRSHNMPNGSSVGFIMRYKMDIETAAGKVFEGPWQLLDAHGDNHVTQQKFKLALPHGATYTVKLFSQVRLVKWEEGHYDQYPDAARTIQFPVADHRFYSRGVGHAVPAWPVKQPDEKASRYSRFRTWFNHRARTCTTPQNTIVLLPFAPRWQFAGPGSTAGMRTFNLNFSNCASGVNSIRYKLIPFYVQTGDWAHMGAGGPEMTGREWMGYGNWALTNPNGTLQLTPTSTATGVGIQVLRNGSPVEFDATTMYPVTSYSPGSSMASEPLAVRYIQTAPNITSGRVEAVMTVLVAYR